MAVLFEAGLIVAAAVVGWLCGINPLATLSWNEMAAAWGAAAAIPLFGLFLLSQRYPVGPLRAIKEFLIDALGPSLAVSKWYDLAIVAVMAGFSEELLFRGVLHHKLGLWWSNVLFGLAHCVTPAYAVLAGVLGLFMGWLYDATGSNLLTPIITHGLYDFLAFMALAAHCRKSAAALPTIQS